MSDQSSPGVIPTHDLIIVAQFAPCDCAEYSSNGRPHAAIDVFQTKLDPRNAVAISYTWGEFHRRDVSIGHRTGHPMVDVTMNLGVEWDIPELQARFIELCHSYNNLWIDQLSKPQQNDEVRRLLAKIPAIYSTLNLVVLFPGSLCTCLSRDIEEFEGRATQGKAHSSDADWENLPELIKCYNALGFCSYPYRIWTRQEFLYSNHIQVVWNLQQPAACLKAGEDLLFEEGTEQALSPFGREYFLRACDEKEPYPVDEDKIRRVRAEAKLLIASFEFYRSLLVLLFVEYHYRSWDGRSPAPWYHFDESNRVVPHEIEIARLLLGRQVKRAPLAQDYIKKRNDFASDLAFLEDSFRVATQPKDYVLSVWPDCPDYEVPKNYHELDVAGLLHQALRQFERNHRETFVTRFPSGLFDRQLPSCLWRPSVFLIDKTIVAARDVYGGFVPLKRPLKITAEGYIPLRKIKLGETSRLQRAHDYLDVFSSLKTRDVFAFMTRVVPGWTGVDRETRRDEWVNVSLTALDGEALIEKHQRSEQILTFPSPAVAHHVFLKMLYEYFRSAGPKTAYQWGDLPEIDHHDIVYQLIADKMRVDANLCRLNGLRLMITTDAPLHIGFTSVPDLGKKNGVVGGQGSSDETLQTASDHLMDSNDYLSVSIDHWTARPTVYESVRTDKICRFNERSMHEHLPRYTVIGAWMPTLTERNYEIGAIPNAENPDALLV